MVLIERDDGDRPYFVVETKGTTKVEDVQPTERAKTKRGEAHFKALESASSPSAEYILAKDLDDTLMGRN